MYPTYQMQHKKLIVVLIVDESLVMQFLFPSYSEAYNCTRVWRRVLSIFCLLNNQAQADWVINGIFICGNQVWSCDDPKV